MQHRGQWGHVDEGYAEAMIANGNHGKVTQRRRVNVLQCDTKLIFHLCIKQSSYLQRQNGTVPDVCHVPLMINDKNQFPLDLCWSVTVLANALLLWRDAITTAAHAKRIELRLVYSRRGSVHYYHSREPASVKAGMMTEKELTVLCLDLQAAGTENPWARLEHLKP